MSEFESMLRDLLSGPLGRLDQLQKEQVSRIMAKAQDLARQAVREDLQKLTAEVSDLRARIARLEAERAEAAAESVEGGFAV
jgi:polyhydroxyalkanoate synthesis regulator phasin